MIKSQKETICPFCHIQDTRPSATNIFWEDEHILCFPPLKPATPEHLIVISKVHFKNMLEMEQSDFVSFSASLHSLCKKAEDCFKADGINLLNANRRAAQQSVDHLHFHLFPRHEKDGLDLWPKIG